MLSKLFYFLSKKASRKNLNKFINISLSKIITEKNKPILNIGSGGELEELIRKKFSNIYSIDIDKKRNPSQLLDICENDFSKKLNFKPTLICCFEVLEHTKNPTIAIKNMYELLNKGDYILASVPFNFHIHDEPNDYYRFTYYGLKMLFSDFSEVKIQKRNGWLESIFVNLIRLEKEKTISSKILGKFFILLYFILLPLILLIQKFFISNKLTTGYYVEAKK